MSKLTLYKNDEPRPDVDEMLSDFFQAQMPSPWPTFQAPKAVRTREAASLWSRYGARLALAACVALLAAGYWSLSGEVSHHAGGGLPRIGTVGMKGPKGAAPNKHDDVVNPTGPNPRSK